VFGFLVIGSGVLLIWTWRSLPETLPPEARQPLHAGHLARSYWKVFTRMEFQLLAAMLAISFSSLFIYITASPVFMVHHLHLTETDFGKLFIPVIGGMVLGSVISGHLAGKLSQRHTISLGFGIMAAGMAANLGLQFLVAPGIAPGPWLTFMSIAPLGIAAIGQALLGPSLQMLVMDLYPAQRGLMSSCQGFTHVMFSTVTAGVISPLVAGTLQHLASASMVLFGTGLALWVIYTLAHPHK
jgi:DHA1 family bicyclomycin/chloramphenicol resistance-like MFS transporter